MNASYTRFMERHLPADPLDIRRDSLCQRVRRADAKIVAVLAPAGFGKTTLTGEYLRERGAGIVCGCSSVRDDLDLARRLMSSLGGTDMLLLDGSRPVAARLELAIEAWRAAPVETFVFEDAQSLADHPSAAAFLGRLLANRPEHRTTFVCTRRPLPLHLTRYAAPHEIMVLRECDLAFDAAEVQHTLAPYVEDAPTIERIMDFSKGWPVVVLMLRRLASEGSLAELLDRPDDVAFEALRNYFVDEVLGELSPGFRHALFVCAAVPHAKATDLSAAGVAQETIDELNERAKRSLLITRECDGTLVVYPLLASILLEDREEERERLLRSLAVAQAAENNFARAAELYVVSGDHQAAVNELERQQVPRLAFAPLELARVLPLIDPVLLQRHPRLWATGTLMRRYCIKAEALLDEAESLWRTLPPDASLHNRAAIGGCRAIFMSDAGAIEDAIAAIDGIRETMDAEPSNDVVDGYARCIRGALLARSGRLRAGEADLQAALPAIEAIDSAAAGAILTLGVDIARVRGERAVERQFIERAIERARRAALVNYAAAFYAEGLIGAWLAGETHLAEQYAAKLHESVRRSDVRCLRYLAAVASGRPSEPADDDMPQYVMYGRLMALAIACDFRERMALAHEAFQAAERTNRPFCRAIAALAVGLIDQDQRELYFAVARRAAEQCDTPAFAAAVEAVTTDRADQRMLGPFVAYFQGAGQSVTPPITISIASGTVLVDGHTVTLSERGLELVLALALRREPTPRARLCAMMWPDLEESAARNALSVCVHRARTNLGRPDLIVRSGDGYALHPQAKIELFDIEQVIAAVRARETLSEMHRGALLRIWDEIRAVRPSFTERWEWFQPTERRLRDLRIEVAHRLASDALHRGDTRGALQFVEDVIALDPCDEAAVEIAMRSLLHEGDRAGAIRQFRQYRETLLAELQCEPSPAIAALVMP